MNRSIQQTTWLASDTWLFLLLMVPIYFLGGLFWGGFMLAIEGGESLKWLLAGILWAAAMWVFTTPILIWCAREVTILLLPEDADEVYDRLVTILGSKRFLIELHADNVVVARPNRGLARWLHFQCSEVHATIFEDAIEIVGPATLVGRIRKKWES